jgi:putative SOS response-associated peptidase YedK
MQPIHSRMPLILEPAHFDEWLASDVPPVDLLDIPETPEFEAVPISTWVNSPAHDDVRCMEPVTQLT